MTPEATGIAKPPHDGRLRLMLLSLALAVCVWTITAASRPVEIHLNLPLRLNHIPRGHTVAAPVPSRIDVIISGPLAVVAKVQRSTTELVVDLGDIATPGLITFSHPEKSLRLPGEITVTPRVT